MLRDKDLDLVVGRIVWSLWCIAFGILDGRKLWKLVVGEDLMRMDEWGMSLLED